MNLAVHLQVGKLKRVAVVFSCPGRHEEIAGYPAAKMTGRNLDTLLSLLSMEMNRNDLTRENITITNAWPQVEYQAKTGRSQATMPEITAPGNLQRIQQELDEITDLVIFCGEKARIVSQYLKLKHNPKFAYIEHLGLRGLCLIRRDVDGEPIVAADIQISAGRRTDKQAIQRQNTVKRLAVLARSLLSQLQ